MTTVLAPIRPALPSFTVSGAELRVLVAVARNPEGGPLSFDGVEPALVDGLVARGLLGNVKVGHEQQRKQRAADVEAISQNRH